MELPELLQKIATSSEWPQLLFPNEFLEQEVSLDSVPLHLTLSSQIRLDVVPYLQLKVNNFINYNSTLHSLAKSYPPVMLLVQLVLEPENPS